jgi:hypothetical protein
MKLRLKKTGEECTSGKFNVHAMSEIIVCGGHDDDTYWMDTCFISDFDCFVEATQEWKDLGAAFKDHDVIVDNYNTYFFEPATEEDKKRGYTL